MTHDTVSRTGTPRFEALHCFIKTMRIDTGTTNCDDCGAEVSYRAHSCPNCGAEAPDDPSVTVTGAGLVLLIIGLGGVVARILLLISTPVLLLGIGLFLAGLLGVGRQGYREEDDSSQSSEGDG